MAFFLPSPEAAWTLRMDEGSVGWKHEFMKCPGSTSLLDKTHLHCHHGTLVSKTWQLDKEGVSQKESNSYKHPSQVENQYKINLQVMLKL